MGKEGLVLHSDQGAQDTSKAFVEYCESVHVTQSMSRAGCPYDNAPMERYFLIILEFRSIFIDFPI
ncbi:MAG TPA: transposase family protein [Candidatus Fimimorpha faecalis]|uniref:Transposase family protein n=1 Tax=Candidatus Fimimorpha faecalis TaxID=2840824 RepID=A0A9D1EEL4_9FIRM|nr:transposase family protein [Candidatus Fimimorpha faecalis]